MRNTHLGYSSFFHVENQFELRRKLEKESLNDAVHFNHLVDHVFKRRFPGQTVVEQFPVLHAESHIFRPGKAVYSVDHFIKVQYKKSLPNRFVLIDIMQNHLQNIRRSMPERILLRGGQTFYFCISISALLLIIWRFFRFSTVSSLRIERVYTNQRQ
jgi:hypothetical protein